MISYTESVTTKTLIGHSESGIFRTNGHTDSHRASIGKSQGGYSSSGTFPWVDSLFVARTGSSGSTNDAVTWVLPSGDTTMTGSSTSYEHYYVHTGTSNTFTDSTSFTPYPQTTYKQSPRNITATVFSAYAKTVDSSYTHPIITTLTSGSKTDRTTYTSTSSSTATCKTLRTSGSSYQGTMWAVIVQSGVTTHNTPPKWDAIFAKTIFLDNRNNQRLYVFSDMGRMSGRLEEVGKKAMGGADISPEQYFTQIQFGGAIGANQTYGGDVTYNTITRTSVGGVFSNQTVPPANQLNLASTTVEGTVVGGLASYTFTEGYADYDDGNPNGPATVTTVETTMLRTANFVTAWSKRKHGRLAVAVEVGATPETLSTTLLQDTHVADTTTIVVSRAFGYLLEGYTEQSGFTYKELRLPEVILPTYSTAMTLLSTVGAQGFADFNGSVGEVIYRDLKLEAKGIRGLEMSIAKITDSTQTGLNASNRHVVSGNQGNWLYANVTAALIPGAHYVAFSTYTRQSRTGTGTGGVISTTLTHFHGTFEDPWSIVNESMATGELAVTSTAVVKSNGKNATVTTAFTASMTAKLEMKERTAELSGYTSLVTGSSAHFAGKGVTLIAPPGYYSYWAFDTAGRSAAAAFSVTERSLFTFPGSSAIAISRYPIFTIDQTASNSSLNTRTITRYPS